MKKINKKDKLAILDKHNTLISAQKQLKTEFVGLDSIIDEIIESIEPWYLFPNAQLRPNIINLFGMTGTGKTSLIQRLFEILDMKSVLRFDTGEWVEKTEYQLSSTISSKLKSIKNDDARPIFILDEFQLGRTLDENGIEIDRPNLRVIWDLLDSGKFSIVEDSWQFTNLQTLYNKLTYLIEDGKVKAKNGKITKGRKEWSIYFEEDDNDILGEDLKILEEYYTKHALVPASNLYSILDFNDDFLSEKELAKYLLTLKNEQETLKFIEKVMVNGSKPVEYDFSDSIIFIIGNLDGAYRMSYDMDADMDADFLYDYTKSITISDIKSALSELYRPEQISRLGNNYVIYRSFNRDIYQKLIKLELGKIYDKIYEKFEIKIEFTEKTEELIYKEGVFATQGVRPVFSTITSLIETKIGRIIIDILKDNISANKIIWDTNKKKTKFILTIDGKHVYEYDLKLKVDNLRNSVGDDIQALVGIHESGHVIAAVYEMNICPTVAVSKTLVDGGYTMTDIPDWNSKKLLEKRLISLLGGYVAEKLIFGEENLTSGSLSDLEKTTKIALSMVKEFGMNGSPLQYSKSDFRISTFTLDDNGLDEITEDIVKTALEKTTEILTDNMELLLQMGKYLTTHSKIETSKIKYLVKKFGSYPEPEYKTKENFYDYKDILMNKIKK